MVTLLPCRPAIEAALERCLCSEAEAAAASALPDPFMPWPPIEELMDAGDDDEHDGDDDDKVEDDDHGHEHKVAEVKAVLRTAVCIVAKARGVQCLSGCCYLQSMAF